MDAMTICMYMLLFGGRCAKNNITFSNNINSFDTPSSDAAYEMIEIHEKNSFSSSNMNFSNSSTIDAVYEMVAIPEDNSSNWYYGEELRNMRSQYMLLHGYLCLVLTLFGSIFNVINIIVLSEKSMLSPLNTLLTGLAIADMLVMVSMLPTSVMCYTPSNNCNERQKTYNWAVTNLIINDVSVVCHTISVWLTVTIAIWRFIAVHMPLKSISICTIKRAKFAILSIYVSCILFCLPVYLAFSVVPIAINNTETYKLGLSSIAKKNNAVLKTITFWLFAMFGRLIPCVVLTGLSIGLLRALYIAKNFRKSLKENSQEHDSHNRVTQLLLTILFIFLITETPSGIFALLTGILDEAFEKNVYANFAEILDILALINSAANFVVYCVVSRKFRITLGALFFSKAYRIRIKHFQSESNVTDMTKL